MNTEHTGPVVRIQDLAQMLVGALALAYPTAAAEEAWNLGRDLSTGRLLALQLGAMVVIGFYVYHSYHRAGPKTDWDQFLKRIGSIYVVTFLAAASILLVLDKFPWDELGVALGRTVVVAFPASFAATIFDSLDVVKTS